MPGVLFTDWVEKSHYSLEAQNAEVEPPQLAFWEWDVPQLPEIANAFLIAGNILVLIFAFCGNSAAIIVCLRSKFSRPTTKFYLISLASSDFVYAGFVTIHSLGSLTTKYHSWVLGGFICTIADFVQQSTLLTNCSCLIAIALDRYLAVVRGLEAPRWSYRTSKILSCIGTAAVWIIPIGLSVHLLTFYKQESFWVVDYDEETEEAFTDNITHYLCYKPNQNKEFDKMYYIVLGCFFAALLCVFLFSYISILVFVHKNFRHIPGDHYPTPSTASIGSCGEHNARRVLANASPKRRNRRTAHVLAVLIAMFLIMRLPLWIFNLMIFLDQETFGTTQEKHLLIQDCLILLSCLKSAVNPFIYVIWNDALRSGGNNIGNTGQGKRERGCCGSSSSLKHLSINRIWRKIRGKSPTSYNFSDQNNIPPPSTCTQKYYTSDKNETAAKTTTVEQSYVNMGDSCS